jgi:hypothetical protein
LVKKELSGYPWKWATKTAILSALSGTPDPPWLTAYQLPTDVLFLRVVTVGGQPIDYEQQFNKLLCNFAVGTDVIAKYTWSVPESYWPGDFAEAVTQMLEAMFLRGIGERYEEAEARAKEARAHHAGGQDGGCQEGLAARPVRLRHACRRGGGTPSHRCRGGDPWRAEKRCRPTSRPVNSRRNSRCGRTPSNTATAPSRCATCAA